MKARLCLKTIAVIAGVSFSAFAQLSSPQTVNWNYGAGNAILQLGDANHYIKSVQGAGVKIGTFGFADVINISQGNGCVGIGVASPTAKLDVNATPASLGDVIRAIAGGTSNDAVHGEGNGWDQAGVRGVSNAGVGIDGNTTTGYAVYGISSNVNGWSGYFAGGKFYVSGAMGIGTTISTTSSYKLAVEGKIGCRELVITTAAWADHVFKPDYNLKPLNEVETFIKANKHLEGIPTEKEAIGKGVAVGDMQVKLLQKVEELTLYMIDLKKENKALQDRVKYLEDVAAK